MKHLRMRFNGYLKIFAPRFCFCFLVMFIILVLAELYSYSNVKQQAILASQSAITRIELVLEDRVKSAKVLRSFVRSLGETNMRKVAKTKKGTLFLRSFNTIASALRVNESTRSIQLLPNGVVKYVYPLKNNSKFYDDNVFLDEAKRIDALYAKETGNITITGPVLTPTGDSNALIIRAPIYYLTGEFWGFSSVLLTLPDALEPLGLNSLDTLGYAYELCMHNTYGNYQQIGSNVKKNVNDVLADAISTEKNIYGKLMHLRIKPKEGWISYTGFFLKTFYVFALSILVAQLLTIRRHSAILLERALASEKKLRILSKALLKKCYVKKTVMQNLYI